MSASFLDAALLDGLVTQARSVPRRRAHHNLHTDLAAPAQRLLVAMEPDSFVRPHLHLDPHKAETLVILRGRLGVLLFAPDGSVIGTRLLVPGGACLGYDVAPGCLHAVIALEPGSVFLEAKAGPYIPLAAAEIPAWSPAEDSPEAAGCLHRWAALFTSA